MYILFLSIIKLVNSLVRSLRGDDDNRNDLSSSEAGLSFSCAELSPKKYTYI